MNLEELSRLDINDLGKINYKQLLQDLQKKPEVLFAIVCVVGAFGYSLFYYQGTVSQQRKIRSQIVDLQKKSDLLDKYNAQKEEMAQFFKQVPQNAPDNELTTRLTDMAVKRNIKIEAFTPSTGKDDKFYQATQFRLEISAEKYEDIWLFTNDLEHSGFALRIESWSGSMENGRKSGKRSSSSTAKADEPENYIRVGMEVSAIRLKK